MRCPVCTGPLVHRKRKINASHTAQYRIVQMHKIEHVCEACDVIIVLHVISKRPSKRQRYMDEIAKLDRKRPPESRFDDRNHREAWAKVYGAPYPVATRHYLGAPL